MHQHPAAEWDASSIALVDEIAENDGSLKTLLAVDLQMRASCVFEKSDGAAPVPELGHNLARVAHSRRAVNSLFGVHEVCSLVSNRRERRRPRYDPGSGRRPHKSWHLDDFRATAICTSNRWCWKGSRPTASRQRWTLSPHLNCIGAYTSRVAIPSPPCAPCEPPTCVVAFSPLRGHTRLFKKDARSKRQPPSPIHHRRAHLGTFALLSLPSQSVRMDPASPTFSTPSGSSSRTSSPL